MFFCLLAIIVAAIWRRMNGPARPQPPLHLFHVHIAVHIAIIEAAMPSRQPRRRGRASSHVTDMIGHVINIMSHVINVQSIFQWCHRAIGHNGRRGRRWASIGLFGRYGGRRTVLWGLLRLLPWIPRIQEHFTASDHATSLIFLWKRTCSGQKVSLLKRTRYLFNESFKKIPLLKYRTTSVRAPSSISTLSWIVRTPYTRIKRPF